MPFEPGALPLLVRAAEGSLRDALSLLDTAIAYGEGRLDEASVARLLGSSSPVHVRGFVGALLAGDGAAALEAVDRAATAGEDLGALCREAVEMTRRLLVMKVAPGAPFVDLTPAEAAELKAVAEPVSADELVYCFARSWSARRRDAPLAAPAGRARDRGGARHAAPAAAGHRDADRQARGSGDAAAPDAVRRRRRDGPAPWSCRRRCSTRDPTAARARRRWRPRRLPARQPRRRPAPPAPRGREQRRAAEAEPLIEAAAADMEATEPAAARRPRPASWTRRGSGSSTDVMKRKAVLGSVLQHATPLARGGRRADAGAPGQRLPPGDAQRSRHNAS